MQAEVYPYNLSSLWESILPKLPSPCQYIPTGILSEFGEFFCVPDARSTPPNTREQLRKLTGVTSFLSEERAHFRKGCQYPRLSRHYRYGYSHPDGPAHIGGRP